MQRRIERPGVHLERVLRAGANELRDAVAVAWAPPEGLKDDEVERALQQLDAGEGTILCSPSAQLRLSM
jgi:hypothetical protein